MIPKGASDPEAGIPVLLLECATQRRRPVSTALRVAAAAAGLLAPLSLFPSSRSSSSSSSCSRGGCMQERRLPAVVSVESPSPAFAAAWHHISARPRRCPVPRAAVATEAPAVDSSGQDLRKEASNAHLNRLRVLAAKGLPDEAEDTLYEMIDAGGKPLPVHFAAVIAACARAKDMDRAERWMFRMKALQVQPDVEVYNALVEVSAEAGKPDEAWKWLQESWEAGIPASAAGFLHMLRALRNAGQAASMESWLEQLMHNGLRLDVNGVNEVIGTYSEGGNMEKVREWFAIAENSLGIDLNVETYNLAIKAYAAAGKMEDAEKLVDRMLEKSEAPTAQTYALLAGDGKNIRMYDIVDKWSQRILDEDLKRDSEVYTSIVGAWASVGNAQKAEEWYSMMVEDGLQNVEALAMLVDALVLSNANGEELAKEWIRQFEASGQELTPSIFAARASADVQKGDFEQVEARMQQMEMKGFEMNEDCLTIMLLAYANAVPQQTLLAEQMFKQKMLRGKMRATREVLEALRAAVGGQRCLSLRRELQIASSGDKAVLSLEAPDEGEKLQKLKIWARFKPPEPPQHQIKWE